MPHCLALLLAPRASASSGYFSASVAFPPDNRFRVLLTGVFRGMLCKWSRVSWVLLTLIIWWKPCGAILLRKKMSPTAVQSPAAFQHNRRRWLQPALSSTKTPRNQGRLENRFFSYANIKYQKIYAKKKKWHLAYCELQPTQEEPKASEVKNNLSNV